MRNHHCLGISINRVIYYLYSRSLKNRINIPDHPLRRVSAGQELESVLIQLTIAGFRLHVDR